MKEIVKIPKNKYKVTLVKMVNGTGPVLYRVVNLSTLETEFVASVDLFDRVINDKWDVVNIRSRHGDIKIIDEDGYETSDGVIYTDEFVKTKTLYEYCMEVQNGNEIMMAYASTNRMSIDCIKIDSIERVKWICSEGHSIVCDIPAYLSIGIECPFCKAEKEGKVLSLESWSKFTGINVIINAYNEQEYKKDTSCVPYDTHKRIIVNGAVTYIDSYITELKRYNKKERA